MNSRTERQAFPPSRTNSFLRWSRHLFFIIVIFALSYCAFALLDARLYQSYQTCRFQEALNRLRTSIGRGEHLHPSPLPPALANANLAKAESLDIGGRAGAPLGRIEISTIGLAAMILEGVDARTLQRAVGHFPGTPLPGHPGNVAIAGHRDTFFRALRNIRNDDEITLTTLNGSYRYRVESTNVVKPEDIEVLDDSNDAILTLVTCYPFDFVGHAPKRFVVRAREVGPSPEQFRER